jgi:hypothetical protein
MTTLPPLKLLIATGVAFKPDHILIAVRGADHSGWQERGLVDGVRQRFTALDGLRATPRANGRTAGR